MNDGYQLTENKVDVLLELDNMLQDIFKGYDLGSLNDYDKSRLVYDYLTNNVEFDHELWERKKFLSDKTGDQRRQLPKMPGAHELIYNFFAAYRAKKINGAIAKPKAYCSSISQIYKMLLEKLGIQTVVVNGYDQTDQHQYNLVKRGNVWSYDDVTLAILSDNIDSYFDYDDLLAKNQKVDGVVPVDLYDMFLGINIPRAKYNEPALTSGLYQLPDLDIIRSHKGNQRKAS